MPRKPRDHSEKTERVIQCNAVKVRFSPSAEQAEIQDQLQRLAKEIVSGLSMLEPARDKELLSAFVSSLFLSAADEDRRRERRQKQAEGIAAAKARGVRFGPSPKPLPDNFNECYEQWRDGELTAAQAAEKCGIPRQAFYRAIARVRQEESRAV